jgi:hypothetical protein
MKVTWSGFLMLAGPLADYGRFFATKFQLQQVKWPE